MSGRERHRAFGSTAIFALAFSLGALSLILQTYLVRELLVVVHGTELVLGLVLASWFFWIGSSALAGVFVARRAARPDVHLRVWAAVGTIVPIGQLELVRNARLLLHTAPGLVISWPEALWLALVATAPVCFVVGLTFPLACRVLQDRSSRGVGYLYMFESAGALAGGLACSLVLIGHVSSYAVLAVAGALLLAASAMLHRGASRYGGLVAAAAIAIGSPLAARADSLSRVRELSANTPGQAIVTSFDTPYEQVAIARLENQLTVYADGLPVATIPDPYETPSVVYRLIAQTPEPARVLFVGTPANGLARELIRVLAERSQTAGASVTFVDPDERFAQTLLSYLPPEEAQAIRGRVRMVFDDPRALLRSSQGAFDLVFVDAPEPTAAHVNRFYTSEFYAAAKRALAPRGVLATRIPSSSDYVGREVSELAVSVHKAISSVFDHVVVTPGEQSTLFASPAQGVLTTDPTLISARLRLHPGAAAYVDTIALDYEPGRLKRLAELMTAGGGAVANSDDCPSSYYYGAILWERFSSEQPSATSWLARAHDTVRSLAVAQVVSGFAALLAVWVAARLLFRSSAARIDSCVTSAVAGFASMAMSLVLFIAYQSTCGALYQRIAVMSALLMFGVALGSGGIGRVAPRMQRPNVAVGCVLGATALFAFLLPVALHGLGNASGWPLQAAFAALFTIAGAALGAGYPAMTQVLVQGQDGDGSSAARAGGLVDAFDHLGAAAGALTVGAIILPAVGATASLRMIALVALGAGAVWLAQGWNKS